MFFIKAQKKLNAVSKLHEILKTFFSVQPSCTFLETFFLCFDVVHDVLCLNYEFRFNLSHQF